MRRILILLTILTCTAPLLAEQPVDEALAEDVLLRAMVDELGRNMDGLELEDLERPYFIEYAVVDGMQYWVAADLGSIVNQQRHRARMLRANVRVGSYELDNTNFGGGGYGDYWRFFGGRSGAAMPIEDDYDAIRQAIWWTTDREYKDVVETFVKKKAFMESKFIEDKPPDFSRETPSVFIEDRCAPTIDEERFATMACELSAVFRDYPDIKDSGVSVQAAAGNKYLVNSEGTRLRIAGTVYALSVNAEVQADDGMELSDSFSVYVNELEELPTPNVLEERCREMVAQLIAVKKAPRMEEPYTGPVLFEPEPAAAVFAQSLAGNFGGGQRPVGSRTSPDDFVNKLNRRILPRFMSVVDDPLQERIGDEPFVGHYEYDDQGVAAQRVSLVEKGRLKRLLMSRNPSKEFANSTGHGRGSYGPTASVGCLIVTAEPAASDAELREELIEAAQDEGLEYGIRIAALGGSASNPLLVYKVYPDGREELVRGAEIAGFDLKTFKRMLAAGDEPHVLNSADMSGGRTVVAPAMLFEELDLAKIDRDFDKPPILTSPLARKP